MQGWSAGGRGARRLAPAVGWALAGATTLFPLALLCALGRWGRFEADDFSVMVRIDRLGFFEAWSDQLHVLNGRFIGYFLVDALALLGARRVAMATGLAVAGLLVVAVAITGRGPADRGRRSVAAGALAGAVVLASPAPDQAFLWISGLGMVTASIVLGGLAIGLARIASSSGVWRHLLTAAAGLAAFLASGAYETTALVLVVGGVVASGVAVWDRSRPAQSLCITAGALVGLAVVALVPGSRARLDDLDRGHTVMLAIREGVSAAVQLVRSAPPTESVWIGLAAGLIAPSPVLGWARRARWLTGGAVGGFGALAAANAFSYWSLGAPPPSRTASVLGVVLVGCAYLIGRTFEPSRRIVPVVVAGVLALGAIALQPLIDGIGQRRAWAAAWDVRDEILRDAGPDDDVVVPFLQSPAGLEEVGPDPASWVNEAVADYYGVRSVTATP